MLLRLDPKKCHPMQNTLASHVSFQPFGVPKQVNFNLKKNPIKSVSVVGRLIFLSYLCTMYQSELTSKRTHAVLTLLRMVSFHFSWYSTYCRLMVFRQACVSLHGVVNPCLCGQKTFRRAFFSPSHSSLPDSFPFIEVCILSFLAAIHHVKSCKFHPINT
ncbi:hypothetical protein CROQUDRAFT_544289 [Cronartium quercuum f. sp. fusiforme G11]|uniref:Uncharacterized protein n=1 Tax=Cronartium quercuum f. sp. fusiforme G11 TaxID=708437 RepID=A0A9P6NQE8_9BASI|nr:hypothetical protein CROQUDRAFT_544289 [Cronartium quercuum f. sp. fusiforme G11]